MGAGAAAGAGVSTTNLSAHIGEDGAFKPGWAKALGVPDAWEQKFTRPDAMLKSHANLEKMLGAQNKVSVPGPNATPEERAAFNKAIGVPDKAEDYGIKMPEKIGDKVVPKELWNEAEAKAFAEQAHKLGFTKTQVDALIGFDLTRNMTAVETAKAMHAKAMTDAVGALKSEWGSDYDKQLALAQKAATSVGLDATKNPELANNPAFIKSMAKVGAKLGEQTAAGARGSNTAPASPQQRIQQIRSDMSHPYNNKNAPRAARDAAVQEMKGLYAEANQEPQRR